jgi:hypothetical protein
MFVIWKIPLSLFLSSGYILYHYVWPSG